MANKAIFELFKGRIVDPNYSNLKDLLRKHHQIYPQGTEADLTLFNGVDQDAKLANADLLNYAPDTQTASPLQTIQRDTNINADSTLLSKKMGSLACKKHKKLIGI